MHVKHLLSIENLKRLQTLISQSAITLLSVCLIIIIVRQLFHTGVKIQPIQVPQSLTQQGLTPEVTAQWLLDEILYIQNKAATSKEAKNMQPEWKEINMEVPGSGFTTKTIGDVIRASLGLKQDTISGEIIEYNRKYTIRIRLSQRSSTFSEINTKVKDLKSLFHQAAKLTLLEFDPFIYASYLHTQKKYDEAISIAANIVKRKGSDQQDIIWSQNLLGIIYAELGDFEKSERAYKNAIALDNDFAIAQHNLSNLYVENDNFSEALTHYELAINLNNDLRDDKNEATILQLIVQSIAVEQTEEALSLLKRAARLDPQSGNIWQMWGDTLLLGADADAPEAAKKFETLVKLWPESAGAHVKLANAQLLMNECKDALTNYQKALTLEPEGYSYLSEQEIPDAKACL